MSTSSFPITLKEITLIAIVACTLYGLFNDRPPSYVVGVCNAKFNEHPDKAEECITQYKATHSTLFG